jgi:hypothetical protein
LLAAVLLYACAAYASEPRYIFFNLASNGWRQDAPETFTRASIDEVARVIHAPDNPALRIGVAYPFSVLETAPDVLARSVAAYLHCAEVASVPALINLDGQNWWETRADLWNWWDPAAPGYNPDNRQNVEWTDWSSDSAVKIGWRNWGAQIRVKPAQNISSPKLRDELRSRFAVIVPVIAHWYRQLPRDKRYLFGGLKVGWEAGIGYNAFYYPDGNSVLDHWPNDASHDPQSGLHLDQGLSGACAQIGYAAVKTAGIKTAGAITRDDIGKATQQYLAFLSKLCCDLGIPKDKVFTHQGGTYPPWGTHLPFWPAINRWSAPGWSFYGQDPATAGDLGDELKRTRRTRWAAAEWWWGAPDQAGWEDHFERTLRFRDCRFIAVYNWDCGFRFDKESAGQDAVRALVARWRD